MQQKKPHIVLDDMNLAAAEKKLIEEAMKDSSNVLTDAARLLGVDRHRLSRLLAHHGLSNTPAPSGNRLRPAEFRTGSGL